jgi:hypothetical protein
VVSARVAAARGEREAAGRELDRAVGLYRGKGNDVSEQRAAGLRTELGLGPVSA